jgi:hypothetical protein
LVAGCLNELENIQRSFVSVITLVMIKRAFVIPGEGYWWAKAAGKSSLIAYLRLCRSKRSARCCVFSGPRPQEEQYHLRYTPVSFNLFDLFFLSQDVFVFLLLFISHYVFSVSRLDKFTFQVRAVISPIRKCFHVSDFCRFLADDHGKSSTGITSLLKIERKES